MRLVLIVSFVSLAFSFCLTQNRAQKIDSILSEWNWEGSFSGNVLIYEAGRIIYEKSYAQANIGCLTHRLPPG